MSLKLLTHQIEASDYLIKKCNNQKGLILYHTVGTGKTISALLFLKNYQNSKRLLIIPEELKAVWETESKKIDVDLNKIKIITYANFEKKIINIDLKNTIVVCDEAHQISNIINKIESQKDKILLIRKLQTSKKILLLTGTPVYNNLLDIRYLINISAGRDVVPYLDSEFRKIYLKANTYDIITKGWMFSLIKQGYLTPNFITAPFVMLSSIIKVLKDTKRPKTANEFQNMLIDNNKEYTNLFYISTALSYIVVIIAILYDKYNVYDVYKINVEKFTKDIKPYIDYYRPENSNSDFPSFEYTEMQVEYSISQIKIWLSLVNDTIQSETLKKLEDTKNEIITSIITNQDDYLNKGRIIGNIESISTFGNIEYPEKFHKVFKTMKGKESIVIYSNFYVKGILKFAEFLDYYKIKYTILESKFDSIKITKTLNDFKNKKINILLLHPKFTEGISILGVQQLHILEPIINNSRKEQLIGRVIRYKSHIHLESKYRKVFIYQWYCTVESKLSEIAKNAYLYKNWIQNYPGVHFDKMPEKFDKDITPDGIVIGADNQIKYFNDEFIKMLIKYKDNNICG